MDDEKLRELMEENDKLKRENDRLKAASTLDKSRRVEFSKLIIVGVALMTAAITVFSCCMIWRTGDTSVLAYLIPAVFTELASATGFYYNKAKAENKIKLMTLTGTEPDAQIFETM
ncbi:MAG: hypothetical protein ACI4JE_02840 [Ruminococcus sp.]